VAINHFIILETNGELRPFDPSPHLCSFGPSGGMLSCHSPFDDFAKSITPLVSPHFLTLDILPLLFSVIALGMKRRRCNKSEPSHDFLASCRGNIAPVPSAAGYDPKLWLRSVPSSDKWLGNYTPRIRERPHHSRLKRRGHQPKKN
jgi:hypothetical protein